MPGFIIGSTGSSHNGNPSLDATAETKRKHRWVFTVFWGGQDAALKRSSVYLQSAQRPHAVVEEAVMHHDEEQAYFAGKYHWEPISLVFYDVAGAGAGSTGNAPDSSSAIYSWFNKVINVADATVFLPSEYKKTSDLNMTNGQGLSIERWQLFHCWPIDVNWNDLDYTNTEIQTIDVSMKFDRAVKA